MKKLPKELIFLIAAAVAIIILLVVLSLVGNGNKASSGSDTAGDSSQIEATTEIVADVDAIALPDKSEASQVLGFEPAQVDRLTDRFVLRNLFIEDDVVIYNYQTHLAANATRLYLKLENMTEDEYNASLPVDEVSEDVTLSGDVQAVYADRILFKIPADYELTDDSYERTEERAGRAVIIENDIGKELAQLKTVDWYENGCKYELYAEHLNLSKDEMTELANYYLDNAK